jgi:hypothetical protein
MRLKLVPAAAAAALAISLLGATSASAATEVGNKCAANANAGGVTWVSLANRASSPIPAVIPAKGVITRWTYSVGVPLPPAPFSATLKILRGNGLPKQFQVVAESGFVPLNDGLNTFSARIPVQAGDFISTFGQQGESPVTYICGTGNPGDKSAVIEGNPSLSSTATAVAEVENVQVPIVVFVEPDADNDGFGDETQDQCPQSAAVQAVACPPVALSAIGQPGKGAVTVVATTNTIAPVSVVGTVKLGKGKKATLNGGTQSLAPGLLGKFTLKFSKGLKAKLKALSRKKSLSLNVTVTGTSVSGAVATSTLKVKLKGQAKP